VQNPPRSPRERGRRRTFETSRSTPAIAHGGLELLMMMLSHFLRGHGTTDTHITQIHIRAFSCGCRGSCWQELISIGHGDSGPAAEDESGFVVFSEAGFVLSWGVVLFVFYRGRESTEWYGRELSKCRESLMGW
jgi:hypothetical protein